MLRRDVGKRASGERGKGQAMESPGTGARRGHRERTWGKIQKGQKVKRSKVTFDKSEKVKVNR